MPTTHTLAATFDGATLSDVFALDTEVSDRLAGIRGHAASCGKLDCGHLARSPQRAIRRAVNLYVAEGAGYDIATWLDSEPAEVVAVVGVLREVRHARPTYVRGTNANGNPGYVPTMPNQTVLPDVSTIILTPERLLVANLTWLGMSQQDIATRTNRALATIRSHTGWLRRLTGGHSTVDVVVALMVAGKIDGVPALAMVDPEDTDDGGMTVEEAADWDSGIDG